MKGDEPFDLLRLGVEKFVLGGEFGRPHPEPYVRATEEQAGALRCPHLAGQEFDPPTILGDVRGEPGRALNDCNEAGGI